MGGNTIKTAISATLLGGVLTSSGCFGGVMDGDSGPITTKTASESGFTQIDMRGSADLFVTIGSEESINIEGNQERVDNVKTSVKDGVLIIEEENESFFGGNNGKLTITITAPSITGVKLSGSGDVKVTGAEGDSIKLAINGSGEIHASGDVESASYAISGSGDVVATDLKAKDVNVKISGSGDADVFASESMSAAISGSGDITYIGGAKDVQKSISGSGDITEGN